MVRLPNRALPPRRREDEAWEAYRRDVVGYPRPFDTWLAENTQYTTQEEAEEALTVDDTRCIFTLERIKVSTVKLHRTVLQRWLMIDSQGEIEEPFQDPDTFKLWAVVHVSPELIIPPRYRTSPPAVYAVFSGSGDEMDAPDWAHWESGSVHELWLDRGVMADVFMGLSLRKPNLERVCYCSLFCKDWHL